MPADLEDDRIALVDLDSTVADYDTAMTVHMQSIQSPGEPLYVGRYDGDEPPHMEARRKMIQRLPGFWRDLKPIERGMEVLEEAKNVGFPLHVLTKGPYKTPSAWAEKVEWCHEHLPNVPITVTSDKSLVYGRVLIDDYPHYFVDWLNVRPRGLVVCLAHPWNADFREGGPRSHRNILRYDGSKGSRVLLRALLKRAYERQSGQSLWDVNDNE